MLREIDVKPLRKFVVKFFTEVMRRAWKELFRDEIAQANFSITHPEILRAWHRHLGGQMDCFVVLKGAMKICAYDDKSCNKPRDLFYLPYK